MSLVVGRMARVTVAALAGLFAIVCPAVAQPRVNDALLAATRKTLPQGTPTNELVRVLRAGIWNSNKTAVAISLARPKASLIFVFLRQTNGECLAVDVSGIEGANLGVIGDAKRAAYDRVETTPIKWLPREDGLFQILVRTRAWKSGQRYTVSRAPAVIKADGAITWQ